MKPWLLSLLSSMLLSTLLTAQKDAPPPRPEANFTTSLQKDGVHFNAQLPPLRQVAGAQAAKYAYYWEFGDGTYSREESPVHRYAQEKNYEASLYVVANYDDTKAPKKKKNFVGGDGGGSMMASVSDKPGKSKPVFENERQSIVMQASANARAEEDMALIITYRNLRKASGSGQLYLFFNEKIYPDKHFTFDEVRAHYGETPLGDLSLNAEQSPDAWVWGAATIPGSADEAPEGAGSHPPANLEYLLKNTRKEYADEHAWSYTGLKPGEVRNLFVGLTATPDMLKDTSAFIHLKGIFAPDDPAQLAEEFVLTIEIVSSHDPNAIAVSDCRVNYRIMGQKKLDYKVRFQNNGEGPAKKVELTIETPKGLNVGKMRPLDWYPKCPICPETPTTESCLDTFSTRGRLVFTFRNIYLPGSRQDGVTDYDSTKGFVRYRIEPRKDMPKLAFKSRASIVFDKNPPIYTNYSKTRFKPGISPGPKVGYGFDPEGNDPGYFFIGMSISPYKSWKWYPQAEVLVGLQGQTALGDEIVDETTIILVDAIDLRVEQFEQSKVRSERGYMSLEIPLLLRKNFSKFMGIGFGASTRLLFNSEYSYSTTTTRLRLYEIPPGSEVLRLTRTFDPIVINGVSSKSSVATTFTAFGDLTIGAVRAGPNIGLRGGWQFGKNLPGRLFAQVSLEFKL